MRKKWEKVVINVLQKVRDKIVSPNLRVPTNKTHKEAIVSGQVVHWCPCLDCAWRLFFSLLNRPLLRGCCPRWFSGWTDLRLSYWRRLGRRPNTAPGMDVPDTSHVLLDLEGGSSCSRFL